MTYFPLRGSPFYYILVFVFSCRFLLLILLDSVIHLFSKGSSENKNYEVEPTCLVDPSIGEHGSIKLKKRGDIIIHYVANGSKSKPLMLFVHGFPSFWHTWKYQLKEFGKDYYAVAIDLPGYGESSIPSKVDRYSIGEISADIKEFILEIGYSSCILVGHDWGSIISCGIAAEYPAVVDKLIVMNGPHRQAMNHISKSQLLKSSYMYCFQLPYLAEWFFTRKDYEALRLILRKGEKSKEYLTDETLDAYKYTFHRSGFTGPLNYYRMLLTPSEDGLKDVEVPSIIIWGAEDTYLSVEVAELTGKYLNAKIVYIDGAGHFVNTDEPILVNQHIRDFVCKN